MKKLILAGLTVTFWILWYPAYTQTDKTEEVYCLPISKARLLVADAMRLRVVEDINENISQRLTLLQDQKESEYQSFTNLLKIESQKYAEQKAINQDLQKHSQSFSEQLKYIQKKERKQRNQNRVLKAGLTVAAGFIVYQSVK